MLAALPNTVSAQTQQSVIVAALVKPVAGAALGQSVVISDTTATMTAIQGSSNDVAAEHNRLANSEKCRQLLAFAVKELGVTGSLGVDTANGFVVSSTVSFQRAGSTAVGTQQTKLTIIPLTGRFTRLPGASAAIMHFRYLSTPGLDYSRLFIRYPSNPGMIEEISFRKDRKIWTMAAKHGDCIFRSALKICENKNPTAFKSLNAVWSQSSGQSVISTLRQLYDPRSRSIGQGTLLLFSDLLIISNYEEEFQAGYIDGTIDQSFKPVANESALSKQIKQLIKDTLKSLLQQAGKKLWEGIFAWL